MGRYPFFAVDSHHLHHAGFDRRFHYLPDYKKIHFPRPLRDIVSQFVMPAEAGIQSGQIIEKIFQR